MMQRRVILHSGALEALASALDFRANRDMANGFATDLPVSRSLMRYMLTSIHLWPVTTPYRALVYLNTTVSKGRLVSIKICNMQHIYIRCSIIMQLI